MMKRRIPQQYTVMIVRTDRPPIVFSLHPIVMMGAVAAALSLVVIAIAFSCQQGKQSEQKTSDVFESNPVTVLSEANPGFSEKSC